MNASETTSLRPSWVPATFGGRCKVFPVRDTLMLPYQAKWLLDASRKRIAEKARQIGFTWATAYDIVRDKGQATATRDAWITSRDEMQARLFIQDLKNWSGVLKIGAENLGEVLIDPEKKQSAMALRFASGATAYSLSSNPDAQAGKRGDRIGDEFALHKDPRLLYTIMQPGITWGGRMSLFSTHRGSANFFAELINEVRHKGNPKKFSLHRITLQDALDQGFLFKLQGKLSPDDERMEYDEAAYFDATRSECADDEAFQQEFCCNPADDNSAFLTYDQIAGCEYAPTESWQRTVEELAACPNPLYIGVDIGRKHDLTVIWLVEKTGDVRFTRRYIELKKTPFSAQEAVLYELMQLPNVRRCCIDNTGIGMQFAERGQERFGTYRVEGVTFTGAVKEELAYPVRAAFEDRSVRVPNDKFIRSDLRGIRKESTASGNVRFAADRGANGHSDRFWALALALHASKSSGNNFFAVSI